MEKKDREELKQSVLTLVKTPGYTAIGAGEVLVSIGAAMMKGGGATEATFLKYARAVWAAQHALGEQKN